MSYPRPGETFRLSPAWSYRASSSGAGYSAAGGVVWVDSKGESPTAAPTTRSIISGSLASSDLVIDLTLPADWEMTQGDYYAAFEYRHGGESESGYYYQTFSFSGTALGSNQAPHTSACLTQSGIFSAVSTPDGVQCYAIPGAIAGKQELDLIADAQRPSLWGDHTGALYCFADVGQPITGRSWSLYRSLDGGRNFAALATGLRENAGALEYEYLGGASHQGLIFQIASLLETGGSTNDGTFFTYSSDGGQSWQADSTILDSLSGQPVAPVVVSGDARCGYGRTRFLFTEDFGRTWTAPGVSPPVQTGRGSRSVSFLITPGRGLHLLQSSLNSTSALETHWQWRIYNSYDNQSTWAGTLIDTLPRTDGALYLLGNGRGQLFATNGRSVLKQSNNYGATWSAL